MKFLILICATIAIASADYTKKTPAEMRAIREECWKETHVSESLIESMKKFEYPDETAVHDTIKCIAVKLNVWCDHEGYHRADLITQFGEDAAPIFDKCFTKKSDHDTEAKWAWHDWKCFVDGGLKDQVKKFDE